METIHLNRLTTFCTLSSGKCAALMEAASVCLESQYHQSGVIIKVQGTYNSKFSLSWDKVDLRVRQTWQNLSESVEDAAYGLAILTIWEYTSYKIIKQSFKGSGFDYWLGEKDFSDDPFKEKARLEVSGILKGTKGQINQRLKEKQQQTEKSDNFKLPVFVIIAEFGTPQIKIQKR